METLIIVESPTKAKTIKNYLPKVEVLASNGHIRDLTTKGKFGYGVNIDSFEPKYEVIKEKLGVVSKLKRAAKDKKVLLATDPDREGEAISWHLANILDLDLTEKNRIYFNEITKPAIVEAYNNPRKIDLDLVDSQESRRILDRIIGFDLSKLVQRKLYSKSAGRVQSVALKIIIDRGKRNNGVYSRGVLFNFCALW
ncbi:MAG: toprim domain-containing protein [Acholeplasmatales bacterium]